VLAGADVVLHLLDPGLGIAAAIRRRHRRLAVVAGQRRHADGSLEAVAGGCAPLVCPCSVNGQADALRSALARHRAQP
jgi:hypothetical protein